MASARVPLTSPAHLSAGRRNLFMAGVLLALAAFVVTFLLGAFMVLRSQQIIGGESVVVASRDIQPREALDSSAVEVVSFPSNLVPSTALTNMGAAKGKFSLTAIAKGQVLTSGMVSAQPEGTTLIGQAYLPIPDGFVAFTIPNSEQEGVAGYVSPGDYIDVIATVNTGAFGAQSPKTVTKTVFTNVRVIRVGPQTAPDASAGGRAGGVTSSLTVVITSCDAEMWSWLLGNSTLRYELRSYKNYPAVSPSAQPGASPSPGAATAPTSTPAGSTATTSPSPAPGQGTGAAVTNACPIGGTAGIGPAQVDARFGFSKI